MVELRFFAFVARVHKSFVVRSRDVGEPSGAKLGSAWSAALLPIVFVLLVATVGLGATMAPARADDMTFSLASVGNAEACGSRCPAVITAEGEITDRTPYDFLNFVENNIGRGNLHAVIFLDSPGGKVVAAMQLGRIWRRLGAAVVVGRADPSGGASQFVAARCLSACVYALIGAKKRVIPPASIVGIHRMFFYEADAMRQGTVIRRRYDHGSMRSMLAHYTGRMGVSPALISEAERISSDRIHILTRAEIARYHLGSSRF